MLWLLPQAGRAQNDADTPGAGISQTFMQVSSDVARLSFKEDTKYAQFISDGDAVFVFNMAINKFDRDWANRILKSFGGNPLRASRSIRPADLASLVASTDSRPGPVSAAGNGSSQSHLGLLYGAQLIGKGTGATGSTTRMTYLEPMAYLLYSYDLPDDKGYVFGGLGPYLALGLWGRISSGNYSANVFDQSKGGYSRFDAGLGFTAGYQHPQGVRLSVAHELGLVNIEPKSIREKAYNRVWSLNVGYPLKKLAEKLRKK